MSRPIPFVVVASPEIAPRSAGGISLKRRPQASVITVPPAIATRKMTGRYHCCHVLPKPPRRRPSAVDGRRDRDHAAETEPVAEDARAGRGDDVPRGDGRQHGRRRPERLAQADGQIEDDERPRAGERPLPGRVRDQEPPHLGIAAEDLPAVLEIGADALEDPAVAAVLAHEQHRRRARGDDDDAPRRGTGTAPRRGRARRRRSAPSRARARASGAGRSGRGRRSAPAAGRGRARGRAARRRSRRRRTRRRAARSSRGSA